MTDLKNAFGYIRELPKEVKRPYYIICTELASITDKWQLYLGLFDDKEIVDILNITAPRAFISFKESLQVDITMSISRLADPAITNRNKNLSVNYLLSKLTYIPHLEQAIKYFEDLSKPILKLRNKRLAHNDKISILYPNKYPFPHIDNTLIYGIIISLSSILNLVVRYFKKNFELGFDPLPQSGLEDLVYWLKKSKVIYEKEMTDISHLL